MTKTNKPIELGEYQEKDFASREAMAKEIERDARRSIEVRQQAKEEVMGEIRKWATDYKNYHFQDYENAPNEIYLDDLLSKLK